MISLRSDRLVILVFPSDLAIPHLRSKKEIKGVIERQTKLEAAGGDGPDAESERRLLAQQDVRCLCFTEAGFEQIGTVTSLWNDQTGVAYVGYSVDPRYRGLGYATEAVRSVIEWIMTGPDVKALISEAYADQRDSIRVMEKAGLSRIDTNLGPEIVRYGIVNGASEVDLSEKRILTLTPFCYSARDILTHLMKWQWSRGEELIPLMIFAGISISNTEELWRMAGIIGFFGYGYYLLHRLLKWGRYSQAETIIQLREGGMFLANRQGFGNVVPWNSFSCYRVPKRGGLELWNGAEWYRIPPQAFSDSSLLQAQEYLAEHGVKSGSKALGS